MEQWNIEAELIELTDEIQCEICLRYLSVARIHCYCGRIHPGASEEVQRQSTWRQHSKSRKGISRGNKYGFSKEAQYHGKAEYVLKMVQKEATVPSLNGKTMMNNTALEWLNKDWMKTISADEMKKQRLIVFTIRMLLNSNAGKTHTSYREIVELMVEILAKTADTQIMKKQRKICAVFEPPIPLQPDQDNHRSSSHHSISTSPWQPIMEWGSMAVTV